MTRLLIIDAYSDAGRESLAVAGCTHAGVLYERMLKGLSDDEREMLADPRFYYLVDIKNVGGLVMPVLIAGKRVALPTCSAAAWSSEMFFSGNPSASSFLMLVRKPCTPLCPPLSP